MATVIITLYHLKVVGGSYLIPKLCKLYYLQSLHDFLYNFERAMAMHI